MIVLISLLVLTSEVNLHHLHDAEITRSLKLSGDVELNPGPFEIVRTVQGSFNQGNVALFGEIAGRQCACNALFSFCWSVVREISFWKTIDLDFILFEGDKLYKSLNFQSYLNVYQLLRQMQIFRHTVNLEILEENLHDGIAVFGDSFLTDVFNISNANNSSGCILFLCSYAVAMFKHVNGAGNVSYFLFDSHFSNSRGITDGEIGFSILMKFESLFQIETYIEEVYQISGRMYPPYFQIQFNSVILSVDELVITQSCQKDNFRQIKRQQR